MQLRSPATSIQISDPLTLQVPSFTPQTFHNCIHLKRLQAGTTQKNIVSLLVRRLQRSVQCQNKMCKRKQLREMNISIPSQMQYVPVIKKKKSPNCCPQIRALLFMFVFLTALKRDLVENVF